MINTAFSVVNQMSAAFAKPLFSSWTFIAFANVGSDIMQTRHSESAQVSEVRVMWWRGTRVVVYVLYTAFSLQGWGEEGVLRCCVKLAVEVMQLPEN